MDHSPTCQARSVAIFFFEDYEIPACDTPATVEFREWMLCAPCADALDVFVNLSTRVIRERNERN